MENDKKVWLILGQDKDRKRLKDILGPDFRARNPLHVAFNGEDFVCLKHQLILVQGNTTLAGRIQYRCEEPGCEILVSYDPVAGLPNRQ